MFFMMGITQGRKDFDFHQVFICDHCGSYGQYRVFMTYMVLSVFFIPCFKWNKQYFVQSTCCDTIYELDPDIGKRIASGESITLTSEHMRIVQKGTKNRYKKCTSCGFSTQEDFEFCPKCGNKF